MKFGILGGSFDPVHPGHVSIAVDVLEAGLVDMVLMVPAARNPLKSEGPFADDEARLAMLRLAVRGIGGIHIESLELERGGVSRTIDTLIELERRYQSDGGFALILGADAATGLDSWYRSEDILSRCELIVCKRAGEALPELPFIHKSCAARALSISSREIRSRIASGACWRHLVHPLVADYIVRNSLYGHCSGLLEEPAALEAAISQFMSARRFAHSRAVAEYARVLAPRFGVDPARAWRAGLLHDVAKEFDADTLFRLAEEAGAPIGKRERQKPGLLHAVAGARWLRTMMGIEDESLLEAVSSHTCGKPGMDALARLVYIADKLEFSRADVDPALRAASWHYSPDTLFALVVRATAEWLVERGKILNPDTVELLESLDKELSS